MSRSDITVTVTHAGSQTLKVVWAASSGETFPAYQIDRNVLLDRGRKVRAELDQLVDDVRTGRTAQAELAIREIASKGHELRDALFQAEDATGAKNADDVVAWLRESPTPRIIAKVDKDLYVPWGLLSDQDQAAEFWCLKHSISVVHQKVCPPASPLSSTSLRALPVLNRTVLDRASRVLGDREYGAVLEFLTQVGPPTYSIPEFEQQWLAKAKHTAVVFFYCHADGRTLALGDGDSLDAGRFLQITGRDQSVRHAVRPWCLVFLDGCGTAAGTGMGGFLEATSGFAFCGFIGVEAKIPDVFALRFGTAFLHRLLESGKSVREVMEIMRPAHWPLSLLYSLCCSPHFRVQADADAGLPALMVHDNFSRERVGSHDLALPKGWWDGK